MFLKSNMRPAFAGNTGHTATPSARKNRNDAFLFAGASETEDFNAFHPNAGHDDMNKKKERRPQNKKGGFNQVMLWAIIAAAVVLVLLVSVIAVALGADKNITYSDNAYLAYSDENGKYHVAVNGSVVEFEFEGEVTVVPSADNSFAYIHDDTPDGVMLYLLEGKKLSTVTMSPISEVLAYATLEPGAIYRNDNKFYLFSEKVGEEYFAKDVKSCILSGDASTVVYTKPDKNNTAETDLYLHQDSSSDTIASNCEPVALSNYGKYIYVTSKDAEDLTNLYVIDAKKLEKVPVPNSTGFLSINAMNVKGDEVVFTSLNSELKTTTSLFRLKKEETQVLANSLLKLATVDPSIAIYDTFANTYFSGMTVGEEGVAFPTYHLSKKFECYKIASYTGHFSPDGDYFYYVNKDSELIEMDLNDENRAKKTIFEDVEEFAITEKGNVYVLNTDRELRFYKRSTNKKTPISHDALNMSMYNYANEVFFSESDDSNVSVYVSEEGSEKEISKFGSVQISSVPTFTHPNGKKTYAYYYDTDSGSVMLFYSSNGSRFKLITQDCEAISGFEINFD